MLIRALEVELHGCRHLRALGADAFERQSRVRPHVHDIGDLTVILGLHAEQLARLEREPGVDTALLDALGRRRDQLERTRVQLGSLPVHEQRDRHAPGALTRDAPVGPVFDHAGDSLLAPAWRPAHSRNVAQRVGPELSALHADEPLRRRPEDHRTLVAPADRITVTEGFLVKQAPGPRERGDDDRIRLLYLETRYEWGAGKKAPVVTHRVQHLESIPLPDDEILLPVPGGGMHGTGARIERHVLAEHDGHEALLERMLELQPIEDTTLELREELRIGHTQALEAGLEQLRGDDDAVRLTALVRRGEHVAELSVQRHGLIGGQRPRRRGPDDDVHRYAAERSGG